MKAIICDIDGTIADASHRLHHIATKPKNWDAFFKDCVNDSPINDIIDLVRMFRLISYEILYVSGRSDIVRQETQDWITKYTGFERNNLFMRQANDHRPDWLVKKEILYQLYKMYPNLRIEYVLDDRDQVVNMWRNEGLRVLQVARGNF
jgi:phosphoglycolate phosphatase-like HAD superfamily hydrolase